MIIGQDFHYDRSSFIINGRDFHVDRTRLYYERSRFAW